VQPGRSRVVVIGASVAGLFAAAAAAGRADSVLVIERDRLPTTPTPRGGVPQGSHQHVLLHRGLIAAEQLLPGLRDDLVRAGAVPVDTGDLLWLGPSGWSVSAGREFEILCATRPLLEHVVRARVAALPHVELRDHTVSTVTGLPGSTSATAHVSTPTWSSTPAAATRTCPPGSGQRDSRPPTNRSSTPASATPAASTGPTDRGSAARDCSS
jgi:2-polyprenyl-6-methoxyphenol hydroxylase-like FAD-dependent oxidoreductase